MRMFHIKASYSSASGSGTPDHRKNDVVDLPRAVSAVVSTKERVAEVLGTYFLAMADAVDCGWHPSGCAVQVTAVEVDETPAPSTGP
jgi:hypothetical protein